MIKIKIKSKNPSAPVVIPGQINFDKFPYAQRQDLAQTHGQTVTRKKVAGIEVPPFEL